MTMSPQATAGGHHLRAFREAKPPNWKAPETTTAGDTWRHWKRDGHLYGSTRTAQ